jgi:hypothetical protein
VGFFAHLNKPIVYEELAGILERLSQANLLAGAGGGSRHGTAQ